MEKWKGLCRLTQKMEDAKNNNRKRHRRKQTEKVAKKYTQEMLIPKSNTINHLVTCA